MKKIILLASLLGLCIIAGILYVASPEEPLAQNPIQTGQFPIGGTSTTTSQTSQTTVELYDGSAIVAKDFIHNGETVADVQNPGSYMLAGSVGYCLGTGECPTGAPTDSFSVAYNENTHFFNVILLKEPLGKARKDAEAFLESRLGVAEKDMCALNYYVGTPYWINEVYTGKNLGFSFCVGVTPLPL